MEAFRKVTGEETDEAIVEPEAQSILSGLDDFVTHFDVLYTTEKRQWGS